MIDRTAIDWWFDHYSFTKEQAKGSEYSPCCASTVDEIVCIQR